MKKGPFWWKDIVKLLDKYKSLASAIVHNGTTCLLWHDLWNNKIPSQAYPHLYSFTKKDGITVSKAYALKDLHQLFNLPLSAQALDQLLQLDMDLDSILLDDENDCWTYIWGNPLFSSSKAYCSLIGHQQVHPVFKWLWKSRCQNKHKFFFWLILNDRLSTRNVL